MPDNRAERAIQRASYVIVKNPQLLLILASASPRRREILRRLELPFVVRPTDVNERPLPGESPRQTAERLATTKAELAMQVCCTPPAIGIGADTVVVDEGTVLGKPVNAAEARSMLLRLRGRTHQVITAVVAIDNTSGRSLVRSTTTRVHMRDYSDDEIERYIRSGRSHDKAGAYGIQDAPFSPVDSFEGCYLNVVGLPLCELVRMLHSLGVATAVAPNPDAECQCPALFQ